LILARGSGSGSSSGSGGSSGGFIARGGGSGSSSGLLSLFRFFLGKLLVSGLLVESRILV
jgi:hypothetical protein